MEHHVAARWYMNWLLGADLLGDDAISPRGPHVTHTMLAYPSPPLTVGAAIVSGIKLADWSFTAPAIAGSVSAAS